MLLTAATWQCLLVAVAIAYQVNGGGANRATEVRPTQGNILLQTERSEMFVRKLYLREHNAILCFDVQDPRASNLSR